MTPELKRAIMKFVPDYFSWDQTQQEEYRVQLPGDIDFKIRQFLLAEIYDITVVDEDELDDVWREMPTAKCSEINGIMLPLHGVGDDYFLLNEHFSEGQSILTFPTLYDYDFDDFQFQEECRLRDFKDYQPKQYCGTLDGTWARMMINGKFSYGIFFMLAVFINSEVDEFGEDYIGKLITYEFEPGRNHGKKTKNGGYLHDMKQDADGLESQLDELQRRFRNYLQENREQLQAEFASESKQEVFIVDTSREGDPNHQFIFTDKDILPHISLKTFMADCRKAAQQDHTILFDRVEKEKRLMRHFLDEQYADIMANSDSEIIKPKKK